MPASQIAACVSGYAARLHAVVGPKHHVVSALGAWLLLALVGPASEGADRAALTDVLGCDVDDAAQAAANLLTHPHPLVASAAAVWTSPAAPLPDTFVRWRDALPGVVTADDLPSQTELDAWARDHTFGLIDRFPVTRTDDLYLILATALATKVSWQVPFDHAPAASLGASSPWAGTLDCVLRTPRARSGGHAAFITTAAEAGEVIAHIAEAAGGLDVVSVAAMPDVPPGRVLAAAYDIAVRHATAAPIESRDLAGLTPGEHALWTVREVRAAADSCAAVLPAWSATSRLDLSAPGLGFDAAGHALVRNDDACRRCRRRWRGTRPQGSRRRRPAPCFRARLRTTPPLIVRSRSGSGIRMPPSRSPRTAAGRGMVSRCSRPGSANRRAQPRTTGPAGGYEHPESTVGHSTRPRPRSRRPNTVPRRRRRRGTSTTAKTAEVLLGRNDRPVGEYGRASARVDA